MPLVKLEYGLDELVRIELSTPGEWVAVLPRLSKGQEVEMQKRIVGGAVIDGQVVQSLDAGAAIEAAAFAMLEIAIRAWSFDEPVSRDNIRRLLPEDVALIDARLGEVYPSPRKDDDRKDSSESGAGTSRGSDALHANSPGSP